MDVPSDPLQAAGRKVSSVLGRDSRLINALRPLYEAILRRYHGDRGIPWSINGIPFRIDPRYRQLMGQTWDLEVAAFLSERLQPGSLCMDVGANAGIYVLQFCHWSAPDGRVIAFEPNPITCQILQAHVRMNGLENRVEIVPVAVTDREGEAEFHFAGASGMSRLGQANALLEDTAQITTVATMTLDAFCEPRDLQPDWLLMDIEGYELRALRGARGLLARCPGLQLVVEMHPAVWPSAQTSVADWHDFLAQTRLRPLGLTGQKNCLEEYGSVYLERR